MPRSNPLATFATLVLARITPASIPAHLTELHAIVDSIEIVS